MSRSKKGSKSIGKDFTSKRLSGYPSAGPIAKEITKRKERMNQKKLIIKEMNGN
jgi:hypothetical protein